MGDAYILEAMGDLLEAGLEWLCGVAGLGTLVYAITHTLLAQRQATGHHTGAAPKVLRTSNLVIATVFFLLLAYLLWSHLPLQIPKELHWSLAWLGTIILLPSLGLYVWGLQTLGRNFNASSGFGVRLHQGHQLITTGPYAYIRHPMYLAVILSCWGGLLLYRTWTMLVFAIMMFGVIYRGKKEEEALAQVFGGEWEEYTHKVPGWLPRLKHEQ